jgi:hypothetical protein
MSEAPCRVSSPSTLELSLDSLDTMYPISVLDHELIIVTITLVVIHHHSLHIIKLHLSNSMPILTIAFHQTLIHEQTLYHCIFVIVLSSQKMRIANVYLSPPQSIPFLFFNFKVIINSASL